MEHLLEQKSQQLFQHFGDAYDTNVITAIDYEEIAKKRFVEESLAALRKIFPHGTFFTKVMNFHNEAQIKAIIMLGQAGYNIKSCVNLVKDKFVLENTKLFIEEQQRAREELRKEIFNREGFFNPRYVSVL